VDDQPTLVRTSRENTQQRVHRTHSDVFTATTTIDGKRNPNVFFLRLVRSCTAFPRFQLLLRPWGCGMEPRCAQGRVNQSGTSIRPFPFWNWAKLQRKGVYPEWWKFWSSNFEMVPCLSGFFQPLPSQTRNASDSLLYIFAFVSCRRGDFYLFWGSKSWC